MSEENERSAPVRAQGRKSGGSARRRPAGKSAGKKSPVALIAVAATVVVVGVVVAVLMNGQDKTDKKDDKQASIEAPPKKESNSLFDAANADDSSTQENKGPVRVTGREPRTLDMAKLEDHVDRLYVEADLRTKIKALEAKVEKYQKERWDVDDEMKKEQKELQSQIDVVRHHPFLSEADDALRSFNTFTAKREVHLRDANDELLPQPFKGYAMEPFLFMVQASKEGGEEEIALKIHGWLAQLKVAFVDYFSQAVELKPSERDKLITIVLFRGMKDYQAYNRIKNPERDKTFALAHYEPDNRRLCVPLQYGTGGSVDDPEQTLREVMFHEATHQLMHYYTKTNHLGAYGSMWSDEGVAEYFGGHGKVDGKFIFGRINSRIRAIADDNNDIKNRIDFIKLLTWTRYLHSKEEAKGAAAEMAANYIHGHVYSQGWALVYFMNNFENGKYKPQFMQIMKRQIGESGDYGLPVFRAVFPTDAEFNRIEVEFNDYLDAMTDAWNKKEIKIGGEF